MIRWSASPSASRTSLMQRVERFVGYYDLVPHRADQFVLGHNSVGILDEVAQNVEALGPQFDILVVSAQPAARDIKRKSFKLKSR